MPDLTQTLLQRASANAPKPQLPAEASPIPAPNFQRGPADLTDVFLQYPRLRPVLDNLTVVDSRKAGMQDDRQLEFYPPEEEDNPHRGTYTAEIFNPDIQGKDLESAIAADSLHGIKREDPLYAAMRTRFGQSLTPRQHAIDQRAYTEDQDTRPFPQWMQDNRLDAYLRGYMFPDKADEWRKSGMYTPEQQQQLDKILGYLKGR
jgi:hypothetical protein